MAVNVSLVNKETFIFVPPDLSDNLSYIIIIQELIRIVVFGDHRSVICKGKAEVIIERFIRQIEPVPPGYHDLPTLGLKVAVFAVGDVALSLIASESEDTALAKHIRTKGEGLYLIGIEVTDIEQHMRAMAEKGLKLLFEEPLPYIAGRQNFSRPKTMHGVQICWAQHNPDRDIAKSPGRLWGSTT